MAFKLQQVETDAKRKENLLIRISNLTKQANDLIARGKRAGNKDNVKKLEKIRTELQDKKIELITKNGIDHEDSWKRLKELGNYESDIKKIEVGKYSRSFFNFKSPKKEKIETETPTNGKNGHKQGQMVKLPAGIIHSGEVKPPAKIFNDNNFSGLQVVMGPKKSIILGRIHRQN